MCGVKIGEHSFDAEGILDEIHERVIKRGCNFVYIRTKFGEVTEKSALLKWAKFLAENKIYFHFGTNRPPKESAKQFDKDFVAELCKVAGEYFVGDAISEPGTAMASNFEGYYTPAGYLPNQPRADYSNMKEATEGYVATVESYVRNLREVNMPNVVNIEATAVIKHNLAAGIDLPILEMMNGNPDTHIPFARGAARAWDKDEWGILVAHEWYGGFRHSDILKRKRLELAYKYAYMSGANIIVMESGDEAIHAYSQEHDVKSELCTEYRKVLSDIAEYAKRDIRPVGGPRAEVAFVSGRYDAWGGFCGTSVWDQFGREEWGYGDAEYSWKLLEEIGMRRSWSDVSNYGDEDTSAFPAYGSYDVVPIESDVEALCKYKYLIFAGWSSMTDEDMDKLTEYVARGGKLLMNAAHLNYNTARDGKLMLPPSDKVEKLFGCRFTGNCRKTNAGTKFIKDSLNPEILYPVNEDMMGDPLFSAGYAEYAEVELCGGEAIGVLSDSFWKEGNEKLVSVVENKIGDGIATLITSTNYPGNPALYPFYRAIAREFISASARNCEIKVIGSERVRYAVYGDKKIYLLNTDYDLPATVKLIYKGREELITLNSLELKGIEVE